MPARQGIPEVCAYPRLSKIVSWLSMVGMLMLRRVCRFCLVPRVGTGECNQCFAKGRKGSGVKREAVLNSGVLRAKTSLNDVVSSEMLGQLGHV